VGSREHDPERSLSRGDWAWLFLALLATAAVFARSLAGELVYDDLLLIARNPALGDLANVPSFFARPYWDFLEPGSTEQIGYWRPLTAVGHSIAWVLGGGEPWAFHAASVLAHLAATAVAFLFARRLCGGSTLVAGTTALLFGLHPAHVESVAWISALNDPLFGFFTLLSMHAFLRWRDRGSHGIPWIATASFFAGLLSKEMAVAALPLCLALDLGRRAAAGEAGGVRSRLRALPRAFGPLLAAAAVWVLLRMLVFESLSAGFLRTPTHFNVPWARMGLLRVELLGGALRILAWPFQLVVFRPFRPTLSWGSSEALLALLAIGLTTALLVRLARRDVRPALAALITIVAAFLPALVNVGSLGRFPLSDRFLYLSVLGFAILLALLARRFASERTAAVLLLVVSVAYGWKSWERIAIWRNEQILFETAVRESPRNVYVRWGLGRVYLEKVSEGREEYLPSAFAAFESAGDLLVETKLEPDSDLFVTSGDFLQTNLGLGHCYLLEARDDEFGGYGTAITIFEDLARRIGELRDEARDARELGLTVVEPHLDLELVYAALGTAHRMAGNPAEAEEALRKALALDERCVQAHVELGRLFANRGEWKVSIHHLERALGLQPGDPDTKLALAQALRESGQRARAEELALELIAEDQGGPKAMMVPAVNRLEERKEREALVWIDRALQADREFGFAWYLKGKALELLQVNPQAAVEALGKAAALMPDDFAANYDYGMVLYEAGLLATSMKHLARAYALAPDETMLARLYAFLMQQGDAFESADELYRLAAADGRRGRNDLAESWLDLALARDPDHPDSLSQKGMLLARQGRHDEAEQHLRRAADLLPTNLPVRLELATFLESRGRLVDAVRELQHCLELERPVEWTQEDWDAAREQVRRKLETLRAALPSTEIGPPASEG